MENMLTILAKAQTQAGASPIDISPLPHSAANSDTITTVLSIVFAVTAAIALLMIVIAGFRFVIAAGNSEDMARARMTIIYAVVGLLVSMAAFSIVTFVIKGVG